MSLRLLPIAILALILTLGVKVTGIWTGAIGAGVNSLRAQQAPAAKPAAEVKREGAPAKGTTSGGKPGEGTKPADKAAEKPKDAKAARPAQAMGGLPDDPTLFSQAEIDLLQKLSARRTELEKWSQELDMREGLLKAAEQRIDRKVGELRQIQARIQKMLRQYDKEQEDKLKSLVKIYETMKPKEAASVFMELDMPVLLDVIERMKESKAAAIMSKLTPEKAKKVTTELARRRKIGVDAKADVPAAAEGDPLPSSNPASPLPSAG